METKELLRSFDNLAEDVVLWIGERRIFFTLTSYGVTLAPSTMTWLDDPDFAKAAREAFEIWDAMFCPGLDTNHFHDEWRAKHPRFLHRPHMNTIYDPVKDRLSKLDGHLVIEVVWDGWDSNPKTRYIEFVSRESYDGLHKKVTDSVRRDMQSWEKELAQREKAIERQMQGLRMERDALIRLMAIQGSGNATDAGIR